MKKGMAILTMLGFLAGSLMLAGCPAAVIVGAGAAAGGGYAAGKDQRTIGEQASDVNLAASIKREYNNDDLIKDLGLSAYSYGGHVFIVGVKLNQEQEDQALKIANSFRETKSAEAFLVPVKSMDSATDLAKDTAITTEVKTRLVGDKHVESTRIKVVTVRGHVVLLGMVGSQEAADHAKFQAAQVVNPEKIKSFLIIPK